MNLLLVVSPLISKTYRKGTKHKKYARMLPATCLRMARLSLGTPNWLMRLKTMLAPIVSRRSTEKTKLTLQSCQHIWCKWRFASGCGLQGSAGRRCVACFNLWCRISNLCIPITVHITQGLSQHGGTRFHTSEGCWEDKHSAEIPGSWLLWDHANDWCWCWNDPCNELLEEHFLSPLPLSIVQTEVCNLVGWFACLILGAC